MILGLYLAQYALKGFENTLPSNLRSSLIRTMYCVIDMLQVLCLALAVGDGSGLDIVLILWGYGLQLCKVLAVSEQLEG